MKKEGEELGEGKEEKRRKEGREGNKKGRTEGGDFSNIYATHSRFLKH